MKPVRKESDDNILDDTIQEASKFEKAIPFHIRIKDPRVAKSVPLPSSTSAPISANSAVLKAPSPKMSKITPEAIRAAHLRSKFEDDPTIETFPQIPAFSPEEQQHLSSVINKIKQLKASNPERYKNQEIRRFDPKNPNKAIGDQGLFTPAEVSTHKARSAAFKDELAQEIASYKKRMSEPQSHPKFSDPSKLPGMPTFGNLAVKNITGPQARLDTLRKNIAAQQAQRNAEKESDKRTINKYMSGDFSESYETRNLKEQLVLMESIEDPDSRLNKLIFGSNNTNTKVDILAKTRRFIDNE